MIAVWQTQQQQWKRSSSGIPSTITSSTRAHITRRFRTSITAQAVVSSPQVSREGTSPTPVPFLLLCSSHTAVTHAHHSHPPSQPTPSHLQRLLPVIHTTTSLTTSLKKSGPISTNNHLTQLASSKTQSTPISTKNSPAHSPNTTTYTQ